MTPYLCVKCERELTPGQFVIPVSVVKKAIYLVTLAPDAQYYAHLECP